MRTRRFQLAWLLAAFPAGDLLAIDKNGVAPQAISLPSGPGSIQGLGESFQPQLNTGSGSTSIKLVIPRGPGGITPALSLVYNSGAGNGDVGLGWSLTGMLSIRRSTDRGVPFYVDGPDGADNDSNGQIDNAEELDTFTGANGEELVTLGDGSFRAENEEAFLRYVRSGAGWEARSRDGRRYLFGLGAAARIEDSGRIFEWCLERVIDPNGNSIDYDYIGDAASPAQKHLKRVRWGNGQVYLAMVLSYEGGRPDVFTSYRSGFEIKTSARLVGIDVISHGLPSAAGALRSDFDGDGQNDSLIRRYRFEYDPAVHLSLLKRVTQLGQDGTTALPTLSYTYTPWTPPDNVAATVIRSQDAPAAGFDSPSVELIDMNGDGLPDLLSTSGNQHRVFINRGVNAEGRLAWGPSQPVGNAPTIDISSDKTHLADATADGLSDLMVKVSNTSFLCFDNTSKSSWVNAPFPIRNTDTWPIWPYDGAGGALSRSFDSDYSRTNDVLHTSQTGYQLWLFLPGGQYSRELRFPPLDIEGQVFRFDLPGTHIADVNGDRLQDLAWIQSSRIIYFPNRGRGIWAAPIIFSLGRSLTAVDIERSDFSDIDGDGLVDLTVVRPSFQPSAVVYWLNRFEQGFDGPRTVAGLPAQRSGDVLRWADMNGNGTTDIVISQGQSAPGEKIVFVDLVPEGKTHLLREADNGLGRHIHMDYESSTAQMVRAEAAGKKWTTVMPVAITVVGRIVEDDGISPPFDQTYTYRDPYYDPLKQEFRGFAGADALEKGDESAATRVSRVVFDTGRDEACLKGKQLSEEILDGDGTLFTRSVTSWQARTLADGIDGRRVCYAFGGAVDQLVHEGEQVGIQLRTETEHDNFGNTILERRLGRVDATGDEIVTERAYDLRLADWRLDLVARETVRDGAGNRLREQLFFYDSKGNLERVDLWLDEGNRFVVALKQTFDAFGNVIEKFDARNSRRTIAYDTLLDAWPTAETIHLGDRDLTLTAEYDLGLGVITRAVSFTREQSDYAYDALGRLVEKRLPGGAVESYEYQPGAPTSRVVKHCRENAAGDTLDSFIFYDGQSRTLLTKLEAEGGKWRVADAKSFNSRKLEARTWVPYLSDSPDFEAPDVSLPNTTMTYDAPGRRIETRAPDGAISRTTNRPLETLQLDGEDVAHGGNADRRRTDGLDRLIEVEERNGAESFTTRYSWNARGELESIVDALGNRKRFRFDSIGRLVEIDDPDRGLSRWKFDDVGNLLESSDARGNVVVSAYDAANRQVSKIYRKTGAADVTDSRWHHDVPAGELDFGDGTSGEARNTTGRVAWVEDRTGETHFSYDERGNVEWILKRVRAAGGLLVPYRTMRQHDLLNREIGITFPDNDVLRFDYGEGSFVTSIRGEGPLARSILTDSEFSASGRPLRILWGNGLESRLEYDANDRLKIDRLLDNGTAIRHEQLTYDLVSNITAVEDLRSAAVLPASSPRRTTAAFAYDELHRLVGSSYGPAASLGSLQQSYDAIGNLLSQSTPAAGQPGHLDDAVQALGAVSYQGGRSQRNGRRPGDLPGPHALTSTASGHVLKYDANGNVTAYDSSQIAWDFEDRIERVTSPGSIAEYVHDHSGRRVIHRVLRGAAQEETWQIDAASEVLQDGTLIKYAFLDGRRVARIRGSLDPDRDSIQVLRLPTGWSLISTPLDTSISLRDAFGADASVYVASGASTYAPLDLSTPLPVGRALWVHVPAARFASLRGREQVLAPGTASAGPLHAWPRLDPFQPALHLEGDPAFMIFDSATRRWQRHDPSLPAFLSDAPAELGGAQAFWAPVAVRYQPAATGSTSIVFYHGDAVGSVAAITGGNGELLEERAHHPFGGLRNLHRVGGALGGTDHDFAGHERDRESGFVHMGARGYLDIAGVFLSADPRFVAAASLGNGGEEDKKAFTSFLSNPQMGNLYAYALRQPLKYVDPDGLEPQVFQGHGLVITPSVQPHGDFRGGIRAFLNTQSGKNLVQDITVARGTIYVREGPVRGANTSHLEFDPATRTGIITIEFDKHISKAQNSRWLDEREDIVGTVTKGVARDLNWEMRRISLSIKVASLQDDLGDLGVLGESTTPRLTQNAQHQAFLVFPQGDPQHTTFERELPAAAKKQ